MLEDYLKKQQQYLKFTNKILKDKNGLDQSDDSIFQERRNLAPSIIHKTEFDEAQENFITCICIKASENQSINFKPLTKTLMKVIEHLKQLGVLEVTKKK